MIDVCICTHNPRRDILALVLNSLARQTIENGAFRVLVVDNAYKTQISKGYETDRGRVYLKYGPPNIISESYNEPSSYPYEIWHYYELGNNQRNKKFVFYSTDMLTNSFKLLHSDAIGEIQNYKWQIFLNSRWYDPFSVDINAPPNIYGGEADDYYRNPR